MKSNLFLLVGCFLLGNVMSGQNTVSLRSPTTGQGTQSVFIGDGAGNAVLTPPVVNTALGNVFTGYRSGFVSSTGSFNVFTGFQSGLNNTIGSANVFLGSECGANNTEGVGNIFIGRLSGSSNVDGDNNVSIGHWTGWTNRGSQNVYIGSFAGAMSSGAVTENSGNVFLGHQAGFNANVSNQLFIHNNGGINIAPLIWGDFTTRSIKFNVTNSNVEIASGVGGASGLKFTSLNNGSTVSASSGKVLSVDGTGNVILVNDALGTGGAGITSTCNTANFITKSSGTAGNLACTSIYDDGAGHVGFGFGASPNTAVNVSINGSSATYGGTYNVSDKKFKDHIQPITNALDKVMNLDGQTYNWKKETYKNINFSDELQYGLIAQDVQKVIPSLVLKSDNGDLALNYIGLIPVLIEAIKDQQSQIEELKAQLSDNFQKQNHELIALENTKIISVSPNPSNDVISVSLNIEKSVTTAKLVVYDLKGAVLNSLNINDRDNNITKTLQKDNFGKGVYIVSLVVNGKNIDSKKIIFN